MPDKMLKFTDIDQQSPTKREVSIRKEDFSEIYKSLEELGFNWVSHITARQLM